MWDSDVETDFKRTDCEGVDLVETDHGRVQYRVVMKIAMNFLVP
jgi:hypothetical protein